MSTSQIPRHLVGTGPIPSSLKLFDSGQTPIICHRIIFHKSLIVYIISIKTLLITSTTTSKQKTSISTTLKKIKTTSIFMGTKS